MTDTCSSTRGSWKVPRRDRAQIHDGGDDWGGGEGCGGPTAGDTGTGRTNQPVPITARWDIVSADLLWPMSCSKENEMSERSVHIDSPYIVSFVSGDM